MKKFLAAIMTALRAMRDSGQQNLQSLKPLEQAEAASQTRWYFEGLRVTQERADALVKECEQALPGVEAEYADWLKGERETLRKDPAFIAEVQAALVKDGKLVEKATAEGMVEAAKTAKEKEMKDAFATEQAQKQTVATRRSTAATELAALFKPKHADKALAVAQEVASALDDTVLAADGWRDSLTRISDRLKKTLAIGVSTSGQLQAVAKMDPAKDDAFTAHLGAMTEIAESFKKPGEGARRAAPLASGEKEETPPETKKRVMVC